MRPIPLLPSGSVHGAGVDLHGRRRRVVEPALALLTYTGLALFLFADSWRDPAYPLFVQFFGPQRVNGLLQPRNVYVTDLYSLVVPSDRQHGP